MDAAPSPTSVTAESKLHFLDYWRIIRIRKLVILMVFLLVVITTTAVTYMLPKTYMSSVRMDVQRDVSDVPLLGSAQASAGMDPYFILTQYERIKSINVLYKVIDELGLNQKWAARYGSDGPLKTQETYKLLDKRMDVRQVRNTSLIEIRVYSEIPLEAAQIAQKIAEVYRDNRIEQQQRMAASGIKTLQKQLDDQEKKVQELQQRVTLLRKTAGITDLTAEGGNAFLTLEADTARQSEQLRVEAHAQFVDKNEKYTQLMTMTPAERQTAILTFRPDENLAGLLQKYSTARQELAAKNESLGAIHPDVKSAKALIAEVEQQLTNTVNGLMQSLKAEVASLKAKDEQLTRDVETAKEKMRRATETSQEYTLAKRDLEDEKQVRASLNLKIIQETVNASIPRQLIVDITDPAEAALKPVRPNIPLNIALGVLVGLAVGVGLAFFIEYLDTSVKTIDDIERALQTAVLGVIPQNVGSLLEEGVESPHAEAYRVLRTNVLFSRKDDKLNAFTVVSGGAGEGKSTTIFNLATIFAQNGQKVLLVDSDLRRPSLHKRLKVSNAIGLTNYLLKQNTLEEVIQTTPLPNLHFLPSGKLPSSSLGILNSNQMKEFIREAKRRYDFVFFDAPPIMGVSDASVLVSEVDMTLLVIQYRKYPQAMNVRARQMVDTARGNLLGVVLNNINISQDAYYYYYSGYDYYAKAADRDDEPVPGANGEGQKAADTNRLKSKY